MCRHFGNSTIIFWRFYSSRPGLGVSTQVKFYEKLHKNRVSVAVRCWFGSSTELKFKKVSLPSHARTLKKSFKVCFLGHLCTQKKRFKIKLSEMKKFYPKLQKKKRRHCSTPGNCSPNLTNFEAKNILFFPSPLDLSRAKIVSQKTKQNTWKTFQRSIFC